MQAYSLAYEREEEPVRYEAGRVDYHGRLLADIACKLIRGAHSPAGCPSPFDKLYELHHLGRVHEVHAEETARVHDKPGQLVYGNRRGIRGDYGRWLTDARQC